MGNNQTRRLLRLLSTALNKLFSEKLFPAKHEKKNRREKRKKEEERKERVRVKMSDERTLDLVGVATTSKEEPVHWIPCHIEHEGNANVDKYFYSGKNNILSSLPFSLPFPFFSRSVSQTNSVTVDGGATDVKEDGVLKEAYLRGRRLRGRDLPLPEGYSAMVLEKKSHNCWKAAR